MLTIMDRITDKIGWEEKVFNKEITNKWRAELVNYDDESDKAVNDKAENDKAEDDKAGNNGADEEYGQKDQDKKEEREQKIPQLMKYEEVKNERTYGWKGREITNRMVDWVSCFLFSYLLTTDYSSRLCLFASILLFSCVSNGDLAGFVRCHTCEREIFCVPVILTGFEFADIHSVLLSSSTRPNCLTRLVAWNH